MPTPATTPTPTLSPIAYANPETTAFLRGNPMKKDFSVQLAVGIFACMNTPPERPRWTPPWSIHKPLQPKHLRLLPVREPPNNYLGSVGTAERHESPLRCFAPIVPPPPLARALGPRSSPACASARLLLSPLASPALLGCRSAGAPTVCSVRVVLLGG